MTRILIAPLIVAAIAGGVRAQEAPPPVQVPFEMLAQGTRLTGHIAVQVKINGKGPYRFIFDTGAPTMLLTTKVAKEAGLIGRDSKKLAKKPAFAMPGQVTIDSIEIGDARAEGLPAVVLDHPVVTAIAQVVGPIEGIVGFPFFARYRTAIDYQAKQLTLTPNGYQPADVMLSIMTALMPTPAERKKAAQPRVLASAGQWGFRVEKNEPDAAPGVTIAEVFDGSAAGAAGIKVGDRLLTLDGRWTDTIADVFTAAAHVKAGQTAELLLERAGKPLRLSLAPRSGF